MQHRLRKEAIKATKTNKEQEEEEHDSYNDGYFCEAKLFRPGKSGLSDYLGSEGLMRFIDGRFAFRMPNAMMLAYVFTNDSLPKSLEDALTSKPDFNAITRNAGPYKRSSGTHDEPTVVSHDHPIFITAHDRAFPKRYANDWLPGPILIRHLWLSGSYR